MKALSIFLVILSFVSYSQVIQKKYPGLANKPADYLVIDNKTSKLVPFHQYDKFLKNNVGISGKPANHIVLNKDEVVALPYLIVPQSEYLNYMKTKSGFVDKSANHVMIDDKETILLSSTEINTDLKSYSGIVGKPANHVMIDGQEAIIVPKNKYRGFLALYPGIVGMPSNYVVIDKRVVVVIPSNPEDSVDTAGVPGPAAVDNATRIENAKKLFMPVVQKKSKKANQVVTEQ